MKSHQISMSVLYAFLAFTFAAGSANGQQNQPPTPPPVAGNAIDVNMGELTNSPTDASAEAKSIYDWMQRKKSSYRFEETTTTLLPNSADEFGWLSLESLPIIDPEDGFGFTFGSSVHFLSGPKTTPIPSRLFDFMAALQVRKEVTPTFSYDLWASIGVYSDFEDSAQEGVRAPGHAVAFLHGECTDLVFGVDYLGRDDIKILPVFGLVWRNQDVRAEIIFPRPRIDFALSSSHSLFFKGELGGGTWDIERPDESNDVFSYRDYRISVGLMSVDDDNDWTSLEIGYVFGPKTFFSRLIVQAKF